MATFEQRVRAIMRERGISQGELAERLSISGAYFSQKMRGISHWKQSEKKQIAEMLGQEIEELDEANHRPRGRTYIPVVGMAQAGRITKTGGKYDQSEVAEWVDAPPSATPKAFGIRVDGDSMAPTLFSGDILICEPCQEGDENLLTEGRIVAVWIESDPSGYGSGGQIGRWQHIAGKKAKLKKDNPAYQAIDLFLTPESIPRIAIAVELRRTRL